MSKDYYKLLNISKTASPDEVKKAFRKLAHEHHPDKKGGNEAKFKEINEAYQVLSDTAKRQKYDQFGSDAFSGQSASGGGPGMNWEDIMRQSGFSARGGQAGQNSGFGDINIDFDDLGDVLGGMFGFGGRSRQRGSRTTRGADLEIEISLEFMEAVFGVEKTIRLERETKCEHCHGNGAEPGTKIEQCNRCGGSGEVIHTQSTMLGSFQTRAACPDCLGEGKKASTPCRVCHGAGKVHKKDDVSLKIPAGIDNGQTVRMTGLGNAGSKGGTAGDLYIHVRVKSHKKFSRNGNDILSNEIITVSQAVLGDDIPVDTVHGQGKLKIPAGTHSGKVFKLSGKGIRSSHAGTGDHLVKVEVSIPAKLGKKEKSLYEQLFDLEKSSSAKATEDLRGDKKWF